jgi:hypothetical protein
MHPLYISDYIDQLRSTLTTDMDYLKDAVKSVSDIQQNKYDAIELTWLVTSVVNEAGLLKHHLFQLQKGLEKIANQPIQNNVR